MKRVKSGCVNFILGHPEHLCSVAVKRFLMSEDISSKISHIIVDEAHCVISWGKPNFRPAFLKVGDLRAILPQARMLALTATATIKVLHEIQQALCMVNPLIVAETPDRPNIYLEVKVRPPSPGSGHSVETSYETVLDPVLLTSRTDGIHFDRTIIYLPLKWCGHIHHRAITRSLLLNQENQETEQGSVEASLKCFIAQYHAPQTQEMKSLITQQMKKPDGQVRLLLATEAYGMGADSPNVHSIIHVGPPNTIETYTQEIGRGGRDGLQSSATLYFNKSDIAANNEHLDDAMRQYCLLKSCRREYLTRYFGFDLARENKHYCCDNCRKLCTCSECHQSKSNFNSSKTGTKHVGKKPVSKIRIQAARSMLASYFAAENSLVTEICIPSLSTGLSDKLIGVITKDINTYTDVSLLKENFPDVDMTFATNISAILSKVMSLDLSD
ncbi:bifunctional 3'-5' exonuclease/ATP-dependent helicase WRN-like [Haliotis cracherodii]|uniref:bifunctional 3'-5' exonuclease/ATP-dependent helicase WRN-like n=1 Tax=Haliotis cracherodii TaxID=6455 RepID=UPI0039E7A028